MTVKKSYLFHYIVIWSLIGFPLLSALTTTFGLNNTLFSMFFRGLAVAAATVLLMRTRVGNRWVLRLFLAFWLAYFLRLFVSLHVLNEPVSRSLGTYWLWSVGACFLPSVAILVGYDAAALQRLRRPPIIMAQFTKRMHGL